MPKARLLLLGWTLNFEAFFYLVFGSLFFVNAARRSAIVAALFIALMALGLTIEQPTHLQAFYTSLSLLGFLVGVGVGRLYQLGWLQRISRTGMVSLMMAGTLALGVFYLMSVTFDPDSNLIPFHASMSFGAMAIVVVAIRMEVDGRLPEIPALRFLGRRVLFVVSVSHLHRRRRMGGRTEAVRSAQSRQLFAAVHRRDRRRTCRRRHRLLVSGAAGAELDAAAATHWRCHAQVDYGQVDCGQFRPAGDARAHAVIRPAAPLLKSGAIC